MVFTKKSYFFITVTLLVLTKVAVVSAFTGLATHDQNPLLIPYWVPHTIAPNNKTEKLTLSTSLFITNTLHDESRLNETLVIDVETYRFDLNLQYELDDWVYHIQIPFISSKGGFMDDFIIKWHDAFGFPQGHRLEHANDQLNIQYHINGNEITNTQQYYDGIGDISLVTVHPFYQKGGSSWNFGVGLNVPSGNNHELISNNKIDSSIWLSYLPNKESYFFTLGIIKPGNGGILKNKLESTVTFAQAGFEFESTFLDSQIQLQLDYHSPFINSDTDAFRESLQMQIGFKTTQFFSSDILIFFSEDILVGSAPDITFGIQINWNL